uniref:Speckle-type POZ protein n=1 Tax=Lygus hesperus TaxID=30085 RepID=A0A146M855_LYGHE
MWTFSILTCLCLSFSQLIYCQEITTSMVEFVWDLPLSEYQRYGWYGSSPEFITNHEGNKQSWRLRGKINYYDSTFSLHLCYEALIGIEAQYKFYLANHKSNKYSKGLNSSLFTSGTCFGDEGFMEYHTMTDKENGYIFDKEIIKIGVQIVLGDPVFSGRTNLEYVEGLGESLRLQWQNKSFADLTLVTAQAEWAAHKVILASQSSVFSELLANSTDEHPVNYINVSDAECGEVESMLEFIYSGSVSSPTNLINLVYCAHHFNIAGLKSYCENRLRFGITCDNSLERLILSHDYDLNQLKTSIMAYIVKNKCPTLKGESLKTLITHPALLSEIGSFFTEMVHW